MVTRAACHSLDDRLARQDRRGCGANPSELPVEPFAGEFTPKG